MKKIIAWAKLLQTKEYKKTKNILFRFIIYFILFCLIDVTHESYTQSFFGFAVRTSDGFVNYLPYIFLGVFAVLRWKEFANVPRLKRNWWEGIVFFLLTTYFFLASTNFSFVHSDAEKMFWQAAFLLGGYAGLFALVFTLRFIRYFLTDLTLLILLIIPSYLAPIIIDHFWQYSSRVTLFGVSLILPLFPVDSVIVPSEYLIRVKDFSVIVGPPCAGIHSLTAFTVLFAAILILLSKKQKMSPLRVLFFYLFGLVSVFLLNSIRVLSIIFVGVYYSKDFAVNLFHKTIGSILLLAFFIVYTSWILPKIVEKNK